MGDEPDAGGLNNIWTFVPLRVPVLGLIQSINGVPGKILPSLTLRRCGLHRPAQLRAFANQCSANCPSLKGSTSS